MKLLREYQNEYHLIYIETGLPCPNISSDDEIVGCYEIVEGILIEFYTDLNTKNLHHYKKSKYIRFNGKQYDIYEISVELFIDLNLVYFKVFDLKMNELLSIKTLYNEPFDRVGFTEFPEDRNFLIYLYNWLKDENSKKRLIKLINEK